MLGYPHHLDISRFLRHGAYTPRIWPYETLRRQRAMLGLSQWAPTLQHRIA